MRRRVRGLGATGTPNVKNRRTDALAYALYYLSRYPAIYVHVPDNPSSASAIATEVNRRLEELVSYTRGLREELRQLTVKIQDCEHGIVGATPPETPKPPGSDVDFSGCSGASSTGAVDPNAPISSLPNPFERACSIPGVSTTTTSTGTTMTRERCEADGGEWDEAGNRCAIPAAAKPFPWGWVAAAAAVGVVAVRQQR
jgi:hypothetical protein